MLNKSQTKTLVVGIAGIIGFYFLSTFIINTYRSLDDIGKVYLLELFAVTIGIAIFAVKKKYKTNQLEPFELLMLVVIGLIAGINLLPFDAIDPNWIIVSSIIVLVVWFVYFGLGNLGENKKIEKIQFLRMFFIFISLTIIIIVAFNIIRVNSLFRSP